MTRIAVTGAAGFLGRPTLRAARQVSPDAVGIVRSGGSPDGDVRHADLRHAPSVEGLLGGVDVLIHLAAAKGGPFHDQYASTVKATDVLLSEAERAGVRRVVLVSSFSVYDYASIPNGSVVDEDAPLARSGDDRDAYAQTKVMQEDVARGWSQRTGVEIVVVRPGVVFGPGAWWTYRLGEQFGPLWVFLGSKAQVPLTYVDNSADALVHLATFPGAAGQTYNLLDHELSPTQREYRRMVLERARVSPRTVVVPWPVADLGVRLLDRMNKRRDQPFRLPGFLVPAGLAARAKPLRYSNARLRATGWSPPHSLEEGLAATFAE